MRLLNFILSCIKLNYFLLDPIKRYEQVWFARWKFLIPGRRQIRHVTGPRDVIGCPRLFDFQKIARLFIYLNLNYMHLHI